MSPCATDVTGRNGILERKVAANLAQSFAGKMTDELVAKFGTCKSIMEACTCALELVATWTKRALTSVRRVHALCAALGCS